MTDLGTMVIWDPTLRRYDFPTLGASRSASLTDMPSATEKAVAPDLRALAQDYLALLELALETIAFSDPGTESRRRSRLRALVAQLVENGAGAHDVVELHILVMQDVASQSSPHRAHALQSEGRLQVLELMGNLADAYRAKGPQSAAVEVAVDLVTPADPLLEGPGGRRRQALELNDTVLQDLIAAQAHLGLRDDQAAAEALASALVNARQFLTGLLGDAPVQPGELTRPAPVAPWIDLPVHPDGGEARTSVVIADDDLSIRMLMRLILERTGEYRIVGEVGDSDSCLKVVHDLQPDIVLLDISMPGPDGLAALPLLRAAAPTSRLVVISGFSAHRMAPLSRTQGADYYLEKADLANTLVPALKAALAKQ